MIPARGAAPPGPHPTKPPELQPGTTPHQAQQMQAAAASTGALSGAGLQLPTATGQNYTPSSANNSLPPGQGPPIETISCLDVNLPVGQDDDFSDMSESSATVTYMDATALSSDGSEKHIDAPPVKRCRGSKRSLMLPNSVPAENTPKPNLTIIFKPRNAEQVITRFNPLALKTAFEETAPDGVLQVRPNERLNLLAVDTRNADASERLLKISSIAGVLVQAYEPRPSNCGVGVIKGVPVDLDQADILAALLQRAPVRSVRRLGTSENVRIVFVTESAPEYVILGYTRYRVYKYIEAPRQCTKCQRFGHVAGACRLQARCSRCGGNHDRSACGNEEPQCPNCTKKHESTSTHCPILRKEKRIHNYKVENNVGYQMAKDAVRQKQKPRGGGQAMMPPVDKEMPSNLPRIDDINEFPSLPTCPSAPTPHTRGAQERSSGLSKESRAPTSWRGSRECGARQDNGNIYSLLSALVDAVRSFLTPMSSPVANLRCRLSDFRQFVYKHRFPVIAISESRVRTGIRLSGYTITVSSTGMDTSRVLLAVRNDLTFNVHHISADASNEYDAVTVKWDTLASTVIAAYIPPRVTFDVDRLQDIIDGTPGPHILTGDFNAHHAAWGGRKTSVRGRRLFDIAHRNNLAILNDGQPTYFKNNRCSALDVTMISAHLMSTATWFADIESHGSDHVPTYISLGSPKQYTQRRMRACMCFSFPPRRTDRRRTVTAAGFKIREGAKAQTI
ncbi:hypothetical protein HPB52_001368 [Rhipicephalus sanguineus]|uniref:Endonuclease/exonuclease/phosphatase domain-containing protein n=1 Tax=Rhipicephalus sanguineus TaxID=34632 RepID=A0A9D4PUZ1_RHISA|nr:hypothetical protein HPB52_001368 [Rhipicephalus sanguineus]